MKVLCVTGPLGSGKTTTLIRLLLTAAKRDDLHLIVNEVGEFQIDLDRLTQALGTGVDNSSLTAGCLGCDNAAEFADIVAARVDLPGLLVIEPTGVADAREIKAITDRFDLPWSCLTLVNPVTFVRDRNDGMLATQLAVATVVGLTWQNESSSVDPDQLDAYLATHAPGAEIFSVPEHGDLPFGLEALLAVTAESKTTAEHHHHEDDHSHRHGHHQHSFALAPEVTLSDVESAIQPIREIVVRAKGVAAGRRFDLVGPHLKVGAASGVEPHIVVIATQPFDPFLFDSVRAERCELPDKKTIMATGGDLDETLASIRRYAQSYPEAHADSHGFPLLGAESDLATFLACRPGVTEEYKRLAMSARMRFLLGSAEALASAVESGVYDPHPVRLSRDRIELGAALAWNAQAKPHEMDHGLLEQIVQVQPATMALRGLLDMPHLDLGSLDPVAYLGPQSPFAMLDIARFGLEREDLELDRVLAVFSHAAELSREWPEWHQRWLTAIDSLSSERA